MQRHPVRACTLLGLALLALSVPARAQQSVVPAAPVETQPSSVLDATQPSVTPEATQPLAAEQPFRLAEERFAEGTKLFKQWRFDEAEQRFREALTHQNHPLIHLYLSRVLEKQGRLFEAYEALQPALRWGVEPPLPSEDVQVAENLRQSLESRLAQLEVSCDVPGAEVFLDGEPWFTAPGRPRRMLTAGQHVLMVRKPGYLPVAEPVSLIPGKRTPVVLRMISSVVHLGPRWRQWQPPAVAVTGIAMSVAGGLVLWDARSDYAAIQRDLNGCAWASTCATSPGRFDRAEWKERIGTGALVIGSSALAAGLAGMFLNVPRTRRSEPELDLEDLDIAPMLSGDTAGISARFRF